MDWDALLDKLWALATRLEVSWLVSKIQECLKGHSSEALLLAISSFITDGQHLAARQLLKDHLQNHRAAGLIKRRLQMVLLFEERKPSRALSLRSKIQSREVLLRQVNELVTAGKLQAAAQLIEENPKVGEEPELLDLLGRIYMLELRPQDAAKVMQRALHARRQISAFIEPAMESAEFSAKLATEDVIDDVDFEFIALGSNSFDDLDLLEAEGFSGTQRNSHADAWLAEIDAAAVLLPGLGNDESLLCHGSDPDETQLRITSVSESTEPDELIQPVVTSPIDSRELVSGESNSFVMDKSQLVEVSGQPLSAREESQATVIAILASQEFDEQLKAEANTVNDEELDNFSGGPKTLCLKKPRNPIETEGQESAIKIMIKRGGHSPDARQSAHLITEQIENHKSHGVDSLALAIKSSAKEFVPQLKDDDFLDEDNDSEWIVGMQSEFNFSSPAALDVGSDTDDEYADFDDGELELLTIVEAESVATLDELELNDEGFRDIEDDYAAYAFDPDELYDQLDEIPEENDLLSKKLSREDRATQKAAELIGKMNWPISTLPLIQQIFFMSGWGQTRMALEREMEKGMTPGELILATHLKIIWIENDYYWIAFDKNGSSKLSQYVLSWPSALLVVRSFDSLPQIEELERFIEVLFEYWYEKPTLKKAFRSFNRFLWYRMANLQGCLPANQPFSFGTPFELPVEEYSDLGLSDSLEIEHISILRDYGVFQTKHPQEPSCYVTDKPLPVEVYSVTTKASKEDLHGEHSEQLSPDETEELQVQDDESSQSTRKIYKILPNPENLQEHLAQFGFAQGKDLIDG
ncbi:MAG: hypothetical protein R3260_01375 [Pseudomonas sp.]|nr:hypothetical protein [Pseudomonas sp.]